MRRFEFVGGTSNRFWEVSQSHREAFLSPVLRSWEIRWNAYLIEIGFDTLRVPVGNPPRDDRSTFALAAEHCAFCPDNIWHGTETIAAYASELAGSRTWQFLWD